MKQITTAVIKQMKQNGEPVTMVTAYDYAMAKNVCEAGIEMILVSIRWAMWCWAITARCR